MEEARKNRRNRRRRRGRVNRRSPLHGAGRGGARVVRCRFVEGKAACGETEVEKMLGERHDSEKEGVALEDVMESREQTLLLPPN